MPALAPLIAISTSAQDSGWFDISSTIRDVALIVSGTWVGTFVIDVSVDPHQGTKQYATLTGAYTSNQVLGVPRAFHYFRVRPTALASGVMYVGVSNGVNAEGDVYAIIPETLTYP